MSKVSVVVVGAGCPLKSMGWYHCAQILDGRIESAQLEAVVEPWYMTDAAKGTPGYDEFQKWAKELEEKGIGVYAKTSDVPAGTSKRLAIISARTADNPKLFTDCLEMDGCQCIFLEKPGAPTVVELETMQAAAQAKSVEVFMGYNKNISAYLERTRAYADKHKDANVTFLHNNNYKTTELQECFERNAEGMLKNMAIHELAILVTYYGVTVDTIASVTADAAFSSCQTLTGPASGESFTDFDKLKFEIVTKTGQKASVAADRCGGDDSVGIVADGSGAELTRFSMPDDDAVANIPNLQAKYPGAMPYFFTQDPDYATVKQRVAKYCVDGTTPPQGVATLQVAIDTLKVAEYLTPLLQSQLS
jgi:predicted dehydrogenase